MRIRVWKSPMFFQASRQKNKKKEGRTWLAGAFYKNFPFFYKIHAKTSLFYKIYAKTSLFYKKSKKTRKKLEKKTRKKPNPPKKRKPPFDLVFNLPPKAAPGTVCIHGARKECSGTRDGGKCAARLQDPDGTVEGIQCSDRNEHCGEGAECIQEDFCEDRGGYTLVGGQAISGAQTMECAWRHTEVNCGRGLHARAGPHGLGGCHADAARGPTAGTHECED
jgi:hypothetical protein